MAYPLINVNDWINFLWQEKIKVRHSFLYRPSLEVRYKFCSVFQNSNVFNAWLKFVDGMFATMYELGITFVYIMFSGMLVHMGSITSYPFLLVVHYADRDQNYLVSVTNLAWLQQGFNKASVFFLIINIRVTSQDNSPLK